MSGPRSPSDARAAAAPRPWLGIRFDCCHVYYRVYRNPQGTAYEGRCPRCLRPLRIGIGAGGSDQRFYRAR